MTSTKAASILIFTGVTIWVCLAPVPAAAQATPPEQPVVMVQPPTAPHTEQELTVSASTFGGYDSDVTQGGTVSLPVRTDAPQIGGSLSMHYSRRADRVSFFSDVSMNPTHYLALKPITGVSAFVSASTSVAVTRNLRVDGGVRTSYLPLFHFSVLPEVPGALDPAQAPAIDYVLSSLDGIDYRGSVAAAYDISARSALHANYSRGSFRYLGEDYRLTSQSLGAGYSRHFTRNATLRLGYAEQRSDYPLQIGEISRPLRYQTIDVGVDYSRPLSRTRRTTVGFGTGSMRVNSGSEIFYNVGGHASLNHQIRRTGNVGVTYSRGLVVVGGFTEPFFADSVAVNLVGNVSRRVKLTGSGGYANGDLGMGSRANAYKSMQGTVGADVALARRLTMFGHYFYYNYMFARGIALPEGVSRDLDRHGVRVGLRFDIPVLEERTPRVTR